MVAGLFCDPVSCLMDCHDVVLSNSALSLGQLVKKRLVPGSWNTTLAFSELWFH